LSCVWKSKRLNISQRVLSLAKDKVSLKFLTTLLFEALRHGFCGAKIRCEACIIPVRKDTLTVSKKSSFDYFLDTYAYSIISSFILAKVVLPTYPLPLTKPHGVKTSTLQLIINN